VRWADPDAKVTTIVLISAGDTCGVSWTGLRATGDAGATDAGGSGLTLVSVGEDAAANGMGVNRVSVRLPRVFGVGFGQASIAHNSKGASAPRRTCATATCTGIGRCNA
jgi:hypothetical protein